MMDNRVSNNHTRTPAVHEINCKNILNPSRIYGVDYALNPYTGCQHGCAYCYAIFMKRYRPHREEWGEFVDVKVNAPEILARTINRKTKGLVLLSSVTDPYQPQEKHYRLTRLCLELLHQHEFPVSILTKSDLVVRDIDILETMKDVEVGFTITTLDDGVRRVFEPQASPIQARLKAIQKLTDKEISTFAFIGPILPYLSEPFLPNLIDNLAKLGVHHVLIDRLNPRQGTWPRIEAVLQEHYPHLVDPFRDALYNDSYFERLKVDLTVYCEKANLPYEFCF